MQIDPNWTFQQAIDVISGEYRPGGKTTGPLRNRQLESWGQLVGRTRALKELDEAISGYSSVTAFCRDNRITSRTLDSIREFYEELPDDRVRAYIYSGLTLGNWTLLSRLGRGEMQKYGEHGIKTTVSLRLRYSSIQRVEVSKDSLVKLLF